MYNLVLTSPNSIINRDSIPVPVCIVDNLEDAKDMMNSYLPKHVLVDGMCVYTKEFLDTFKNNKMNISYLRG